MILRFNYCRVPKVCQPVYQSRLLVYKFNGRLKIDVQIQESVILCEYGGRVLDICVRVYTKTTQVT